MPVWDEQHDLTTADLEQLRDIMWASRDRVMVYSSFDDDVQRYLDADREPCILCGAPINAKGEGHDPECMHWPWWGCCICWGYCPPRNGHLGS